MRMICRSLFTPLFVLLALVTANGAHPSASVAQAAAPPATAAATAELDSQAVYDRIAPAIGLVRVTTGRSGGSGSAFAVDPSGWLITAAHVARGADRIMVDMGDGQPVEARLAGYDARRDLALLKINVTKPLPMLEFSDSSTLRPGDPIAAIGNPGGRPRVMSTGKVLALQETAGGLASEIMIRFSAAVAPGNSGGPLVNARGQVVGVVVAIAFDAGGARTGLAVSSAAVRAVYNVLADGGRFERAWIGIAGRTLEPQMVRTRRFPVPQGVVIFQVVEGGPADRAGLRADVFDGPLGDVIVAIDGRPVTRWEDLLHILGDREPGQRVMLRIARGEGQMEIPVILGARP
ncbi:MAG: PDZ domain-containing protein [Armatimonadetes bacterium]|nr:PDZ domain-containing protein [Armatimonadota bacterium]